VQSIRSDNAIKQAQLEANQFVERGLQSLRTLPDSRERQLLEDLANYIISREL